MTTMTSTVSSTTFPATSLEASLRAELQQLIQGRATVHGITLPATIAALTAFTIEIDSLSVVDILCVLDAMLPFQLKESVVRAGGYTSIAETVAHLMPRIEKAWKKHHGITV